MLVIALVVIGITVWPINSLILGDYYLIVGNGTDANIIDTSVAPVIPFQYVRSGNNTISATYTFTFPIVSQANPALPILITLPTNATNLAGRLTLSANALPPGQASLNIVQRGSNKIALRYQPSGSFVIGSDLVVSNWTVIFIVVYTIAP